MIRQLKFFEWKAREFLVWYANSVSSKIYRANGSTPDIISISDKNVEKIIKRYDDYNATSLISILNFDYS